MVNKIGRRSFIKKTGVIGSVISFSSSSLFSSSSDEKRIIIVVIDENFEFNNKAKKYQKELKERDISIVFFKKGIAYLDNKIISDRFSKSVEKKIKSRKSRYSLILLGKDGSVKNTYPYETKLSKIFYDIDQMPMRKSEMRKSLKN